MPSRTENQWADPGDWLQDWHKGEKGVASAMVWAQAEGQTWARDCESSPLAHCEREPQYHCDPLTFRTLWIRQVGRLTLWAQWAGGLRALVALGTTMAMAEWPRPGWDSYHNPNTNTCQDVGNSILLLLGFIICINIGVNMLWSRLRVFLHQVFQIICEKEAVKLSSPEKQNQSSKKQSSPAVHLRCTMDPVKMTVTPPPTRRYRRRRASPSRRSHRPVAWAPDTDDEKPPHQHPAICNHHWDDSNNWEGFQTTQRPWTRWTQDALEPPPQTIRFQPTVQGRPLKTEIRSELGLEAYVYPVNPPPPSPEAVSHKNSGAGAENEVEQYQPAPLTFLGPVNIPDIPRRGSSARVVYDARDVRRRLRELTREVEALSRCYPLVSESSTAEGIGKEWVYRPVTGR